MNIDKRLMINDLKDESIAKLKELYEDFVKKRKEE